MNVNSAQRTYVKDVRRRRPVPVSRAAARARLGSIRGPMSRSTRSIISLAAKETGYVDLAVATRALDTTGSLTLIATIAQGSGQQQRVGKKVLLESLQIRGSVFSGSTTNLALGTVMIVYDRRPTGSLPSITDVLVSINSKSMNNDDNAGRFRIIRRMDFSFTGNSATPATGKEFQQVMEYIDLKKKPAVYKSVNTGAIGDIEEGALYLLTLGDVAAGTAAASSSMGIRTRFTDV